MLDTLLRDIRFALRTLVKAPSFTAAVVATIALAVGATTAMFAVVDTILLRPLPFPGSDRTFALCETNPAAADFCGASARNVADWDRASAALESAGVARTETFIANHEGERFMVSGGIATPGFFKALELRPMLGRGIEERDLPPGSNQVVVVSHAFWQSRLHGDPAAIGRPITFEERPFTVVGVLPADAYVPDSYLAETEVWKPLTASVDNVEHRPWRGFIAIGRRAAGVTFAEMASELELRRAQLAAEYPEANRDWGLRIVDLKEHLVTGVRSRLWIFLGAVGFVLLIACANVASLLLVRATGRGPEFAVRAAMGAGRGRLVQQLITESLILSLAGGAMGLLLAAWATSAFVALAPATIPRLNEVGVDGRVALFACLLAAATAIVFGFGPARHASKTDLTRTLNGVRTTAGGETRLRAALVIAELALALVLLAGAGLLGRGFGRFLQWDPGIDREGLATMWMLPGEVADRVAVMERVRDEVATIPGIRAAAMGSGGPLLGAETGGLVIEGRPAVVPAEQPSVNWLNVGPEYFDTLGVRILRGRRFTHADTRGSEPVGIVNETFARRFFSGQDPIGQRITVQNHPSVIVGVVADTRPARPDRPTPPEVYWPYRQFRRGAATLFLRTMPGVGGLEKAVRARAAKVDPGMQLTAMQTLDERFAKYLVSPRFNMLLVASFALVALLLSAVGVYGVIAFALASRTRELGVRIALGATPGQVLGTVLRRGMALAAVGIGLGCLGALAVGRLLTSLLYGVPPTDPIALTGAIALLTLVAALACWVPARRASRLDPVRALHME